MSGEMRKSFLLGKWGACAWFLVGSLGFVMGCRTSPVETNQEMISEEPPAAEDADGVVLNVNATKRASAQVQVAKMALAPWQASRIIPAKLELDPDRHFAITAPIDVVVEDVLVGLGKQVESGAPLLQLSGPEITKFRGDLTQAQLRLSNLEKVADWHRQALHTVSSLAESSSQESPATWNERIARLEKYSQHSVFGKAGGNIMEAVFRLRSAESVLIGSKQQGVQEALPQKIMVQRETEYASAASAFRATVQQSVFDLQQMVAGAEADCHQAANELKTIEAELHHLLGVPGDVEEDRRILAAGGGGEASYIYRSPRAGTVIQRNYARGERAAMGETLVLVADLAKLWVVGELRPQDWDLLSLANESNLKVEVIGLDRLGTLPCKLVYLGGQVEPQSGAIRIAVGVENVDSLLRPGMTARLILEQGTADNVRQVPASAVFTHDHVDYILVQQDEEHFVMTKVRLGRRTSQHAELLDALPDDTEVMVHGVFPIASEALLETEE